MTRIPARRLIFVGCEGGSERSYAAFLKRLADEAGLHVHLETRDLGGGDAKTALDIAVREFKKYCESAGRNTPGYVLLDTDRADGFRDALRATAASAGLTIIWQDPCHEALLLRHFAGEENTQPHDCGAAEKLLLRQWSTYKKPSPAVRTAKVLTLEHVLRAALVTPALRALLDEIRL